MATYNGELHLRQQLDSLFSQTLTDFSLHVQDDASTDGTWDILTEYRNLYPNKIFLTRRDQNSGSSKHNFLELITKIQEDYVMLCDQDDVWMPDKIEKTLDKMRFLENKHNSCPLLVFADLRVVDRQLNVISNSYKKSMNSNFNRTRFNQVLIQNVITGCTTMYNRNLAELFHNKWPSYCVMHDWWIMLVASAFGQIDCLYDQTILYRQHGQNEIGAKDVRTLTYKINRLSNADKIKKAIRETYWQAECFLDMYKTELTDTQKATIKSYCDIPKQNKFRRWTTLLRIGSLKSGFSRKIAHFIFV